MRYKASSGLSTPRPPLLSTCVNHGRAHIGVAQQFLNRANVVPGLQQMGGKRMTQHMRAHRLGDGRQPGRLAHRALHRFGVNMMAPLELLPRDRVGARIDGAHRRRKDKLPRPTPVCFRIFDRQRMRQMDAAKSCLKVFFMQRLRLLQLTLQRLHQVFRQYGNSIFIAFAFANQNLAPRKFNILDAQTQCLQQTHARAI